jgi:integrase/recombinase XerD
MDTGCVLSLFFLLEFPPMTALRQRFIEDLQLRNRSPKTIKCYVNSVAQFAKRFGRSPEKLTVEHVRQYQLELLRKKVSWSTFNVAVCALRFLYGITLGRKDFVERLPYGRMPKKIPMVLSRSEVLKFLQSIRCRKQRMLLITMYATGMRVGEAARLTVADIDSQRMTILVARGKGNKQRLVPLSVKLLAELRQLWRTHRHPVWLFPSRQLVSHLGIGDLQKACQRAQTRAGLKRRFSTHVLRHTFATELLEAGVDLVCIQRILGHQSLRTTALYMHVRRNHLQAACQALDLLPWEELLRVPAEPPAPPLRSRSPSAKSSDTTEPGSSKPGDPA